jgi:hypothetical protein
MLRSMAAAMALCGTAGVHAAPAWNESVNGDLSNDGLSPTAVAVSAGSNTVIGVAGNPGTGIDRDYFRVTVPPGSTLTSLVLLDNTFVSGGSSFMAMQVGPQVTVTPSGGGVQNLLGFVHYDNSMVGTDLLPTIAPSFPNGLPSGTYSVWVQELGGVVPYGFDFVITAQSSTSSADAPLPTWAYAVLAMAFLLVGSRTMTLSHSQDRHSRR